jgi:thiol-disulfide isomerase/thioredoxin
MQKIAIIIGILIGIAAAISVTRNQQTVPRTGEAFQAFKQTVSTIIAYDNPEPVADSVKLVNGKGNVTPLKDFRGKPVILNFWATWCAPCVKELPSLAKLKELRPDIHVLAVSQDLQKDAAGLDAFLKRHQAGSLEIYQDQEKGLKKAFPVNGLPSTYILSPEGKIIYKIEGDTDWSSRVTLKFIDSLMN